MRIAVTGSIATDHLMTFPGRFTDHLVPGELSHVSLSFLADSLEVRRGGAAANISYGLGQLGLSPVLVGAVGPDFADYQVHLKEHGVDTDSVHVSATEQTARFVCTTDQEQNQIATFYAGAMAEARTLSLAPVADRTGGLDLVLISPDDPEAMVRHTEECRALGVPFAADPSQQLARLTPEQVRGLVDGADRLFTNAYEAALVRERTGWTTRQILDRVGSWVTTLGADGVRIERAGQGAVTVPAAPVRRAVDPTGVGDAFRAGFLAALAAGLPEPAAARLGCVLAALVLEAPGPQEYTLDRETVTARLTEGYGHEAATALAPFLEAAL
ncbi:carbohydrate kinase family protein [Streptomyces sp. L2]|uniref:carbohydrate kinase family protein n=1 Tax=Streptomyces sp. L2 TaxID=2162665 RepID=UPI001F50B83B|nr:carbohydrate kinase family protein [Streptomyces sp. L2]